MKNLNLTNKLIYVSFFILVAFVFVFSIFYFLFDLKENIDLAIVIGFVMLLVMHIFLVVFIQDLVLKDIHLLKEKISKISTGNLNDGIRVNRKDEIGEIFEELDNISFNQKEVLGKAKNAAEKVELASKDVRLLIIENKDILNKLAENISLVNEGTSQQIKGIEAVEMSVEEMATGINRINTTTTEVASHSNSSVEQAKKGNMALEKVVMQMNGIQQNSEESMTIIKVLGEQMKEIQKIVDVIRSISSRTNLLALNATIEAERADANGEGFIVVAEEIKDLAIKATESTVKIEKIARNIMERKDRAIEQIEKSGRDIHSGIQVVNEANQAFNKIMYSMGDIGTQLNEVSSSSEQLSTNTYQIVGSIGNASKIAKEFLENSSGIEVFVEQQEKSVERLIKSVESLNMMTHEINNILDAYNKR